MVRLEASADLTWNDPLLKCSGVLYKVLLQDNPQVDCQYLTV